MPYTLRARSGIMPGSNDTNGNSTLLPSISAAPTSSLIQARDENEEEFSPLPSYGAFVPTSEFLPLGGGGGDDYNSWGEDGRVYATDMDDDDEEVDPGRVSATTLIYLCAFCSSLTSVLLGYGARCCGCCNHGHDVRGRRAAAWRDRVCD